MQEELKEAQSRILQQIGRNIILYQYFETLLKSLISKSSISGYSNDIKSSHLKHLDQVNKSTMGSLVNSFLNNILDTSENPKSSISPKKLTRIWMSMNTSIVVEENYLNEKNEILAQVIKDRNNTVHHFMNTYNISSIEGCRHAEEQLILQMELLKPEILDLEEHIQLLDGGLKDFAAALQSEEGKQLIYISLIQSSKLAQLLETTATEIAREDGWSVLSIAEQRIRQQSSKELDLLQKNHNVKTLKEFLILTDLFDINEERTNKGGRHLLYRRKSKDISS